MRWAGTVVVSAGLALAQPPLVRVSSPMVALTQVLVIDGSGAAARLYLASGVTTARTGGGLEVQTDLSVMRQIDEGRTPGPKMYVTAGYLEGPGSFTPQMLELRNAGEARAFVEYWAGLGATSFKAYMHITRAELEAAIPAAHARKLKVCRPPTASDLAGLDVRSEPVQQMIRDLVKHNVAITSTLAVFEVAPPLQQRFLDALSPQTALNYLSARDRLPEAAHKMS